MLLCHLRNEPLHSITGRRSWECVTVVRTSAYYTPALVGLWQVELLGHCTSRLWRDPTLLQVGVSQPRPPIQRTCLWMCLMRSNRRLCVVSRRATKVSFKGFLFHSGGSRAEELQKMTQVHSACSLRNKLRWPILGRNTTSTQTCLCGFGATFSCHTSCTAQHGVTSVGISSGALTSSVSSAIVSTPYLSLSPIYTSVTC